MEIKTILFDMGGVVDYFSNQDMEKKLLDYFGIYNKDSFSDVWENYNKIDLLFLKGLIDETTFFTEFEKETGVIIPKEKNLFIKFFNPQSNFDMIEIINRLKENNYRVLCGTNVEPPHRVYHERKGDYSIFDKVYTSDKLHFAKPDPNFFISILHEENIKPQNVLFIDDTYENIKTAEQLGFNVHHFSTEKVFRDFLLKNNIYNSYISEKTI